MESVKIPVSKMAAINRIQYHPPPPISFCEGPRIIQKLIDVVIQILELPLYIPPSLSKTWPPRLYTILCAGNGPGGGLGRCGSGAPPVVGLPVIPPAEKEEDSSMRFSV